MRNLVAKVELSDDTVRSLRANVENANSLLTSLKAISTDPAVQSYSPKSRELVRLFAPIIRDMRTVIDGILQRKALDAKQVKFVETVRKVVAVSGTKNVLAWFEKNVPLFQKVLEFVSLPDKDLTSSDVLQSVGSFNVHNTIAATPIEFSNIAKMLSVVDMKIKREGKLARVLYGDVYLSRKPLKSSSLAWYNIAADDVYVRPVTKDPRGAVYSLMHELGHRYWYKFMSEDERRKFQTYHMILSYQRSDKALHVGQRLPVDVRGEDDPIITGIDRVRGVYLVGDKAFSITKIQKLMVYPTAYASTNAVEMFAEMFAMYIERTLQPEHVEKFKTEVGL